MKFKIFSILALSVSLLSFTLLHCSKGESGSVNTLHQSLFKELQGRLDKLGSFEARYQAVSGTKKMDIMVLSNPKQKFIMVKRAIVGIPDIYLIFDYKDTDNCRMLTIEGKEGSRISLDFGNIFGIPDNPAGVLICILRGMGEQAGRLEEGTDYQKITPSLSLGLSKENLIINVGFASEDKGLAVSWLKYNEFANAVKMSESPEYIRFEFKDNHEITIEKKSGLLYKDSWVNDTEQNAPREIRLVSFSPASDNAAYASAIPQYSKIRFIELTSRDYYMEIADSITKNLNGLSKNDMETFHAFKRKNSTEIINAARNMARQMIRENGKAATDQKEKTALKEKLIASYKNDVINNPGKNGGMDFNKYLDSLTADRKHDMSKFASPEFIMKVDNLMKMTRELISRIPLKEREPIEDYYNICGPAIAEGIIAGTVENIIEDLKQH